MKSFSPILNGIFLLRDALLEIPNGRISKPFLVFRSLLLRRRTLRHSLTIKISNPFPFFHFCLGRNPYRHSQESRMAAFQMLFPFFFHFCFGRTLPHSLTDRTSNPFPISLTFAWARTNEMILIGQESNEILFLYITNEPLPCFFIFHINVKQSFFP